MDVYLFGFGLKFQQLLAHLFIQLECLLVLVGLICYILAQLLFFEVSVLYVLITLKQEL